MDAVLRWRVENLEKCVKRDANGVCQDNFIDCGAVTPNKVGIERVITLENMGTNAVAITDLAFNANQSIFTLKAEDGSVPTQVEVPARANGSESPGQAELMAVCRPVALGRCGSHPPGDRGRTGSRSSTSRRGSWEVDRRSTRCRPRS